MISPWIELDDASERAHMLELEPVLAVHDHARSEANEVGLDKTITT